MFFRDTLAISVGACATSNNTALARRRRSSVAFNKRSLMNSGGRVVVFGPKVCFTASPTPPLSPLQYKVYPASMNIDRPLLYADHIAPQFPEGRQHFPHPADIMLTIHSNSTPCPFLPSDALFYLVASSCGRAFFSVFLFLQYTALFPVHCSPSRLTGSALLVRIGQILCALPGSAPSVFRFPRRLSNVSYAVAVEINGSA